MINNIMIILLFAHVVYVIKEKFEEDRKKRKAKMNRFNTIYAETTNEDAEAENLDVRNLV